MPKMCLCSVSVFRRGTVFKLLTPKFHRSYRKKSVFEVKRPHNGKFSKFRCERMQRHMDTCIPAVWWKLVKRKRSNVWYSSRKKVGIFAPLPWASGAMSPKILQDHSFPIPHPSAKFCPNPSSFRGDISENFFQSHHNIGLWASRR